MKITTDILVETPESIDLQAELAGVIVRGLAFAIDFIIRAVVLMILRTLLALGGWTGIGLLLIAWFLLEWFYPVFFEVFWQGQTPGKRRMGIAVVNDDLTPISWGTSMIRNLLRWADFFPAFYTAGLVSMAASTRFQRLGDMAAGTLVIYREANGEQHPGRISDAKVQPPPVALEREDQIAMIGYLQRKDQLSEDRRQELADILAPVLPAEGPQRVDYLHGVGRWLLGDRQDGS